MSVGRRALVVFGIGAVVAACAAAALPRPRPLAPEVDGGRDASVGDAGGEPDASPPIDPVALRERLAPGMRELEHRTLELADAGTFTVAAPSDADRCYRIAIVADAIVDASLTDDAGHVLATARGRNATLGTRGPVCLRRGDHATIAIRGVTRAEIFVWAP